MYPNISHQLCYFAYFRMYVVGRYYYMTSSVSGQDEPKLALWLATRVDKMELSCPLGIRALSRKKNLSCFGVLSPDNKIYYMAYNKSFQEPITGLLILYWPSFFGKDGWILTSFFFCVFMGLDFVSVHKHAQKKTRPISSHLDHTLGQ